jgi:hypothetical protein
MISASLTAAVACLLVMQANLPKEKQPMKTATGSFEVKMLPPEPASPSGYVRLSLDKTFQGALTGTSRVEMMATNDGSSPAGGYVALEKFTGQLDGKSGSFVLQHSGIMAPGLMEIRVVISPGSGSGGLAGIAGTLEIRREGKQHFYTLHYELPQ